MLTVRICEDDSLLPTRLCAARRYAIPRMRGTEFAVTVVTLNLAQLVIGKIVRHE